MKINELIFLTSLFYLFISCNNNDINDCPKRPLFGRYGDSRIQIKNNSSNSIAYEWTNSYPDTSLHYVTPINLVANPFLEIQSGKSDGITHTDCWNNEFNNATEGKLLIFIFDPNIIRTTPWDSIESKYLILKRYTLTLNMMKQQNWTINYPY